MAFYLRRAFFLCPAGQRINRRLSRWYAPRFQGDLLPTSQNGLNPLCSAFPALLLVNELLYPMLML